MKKIWIMILTIAICAVSFAGCAGDAADSAQQPSDSAEESAVEETPAPQTGETKPAPAPTAEAAQTASDEAEAAESEEWASESSSETPLDVDATVTRMPNGNNINFGGINFYIDDPEYCTSDETTDEDGNSVKTWMYPVVNAAGIAMIEVNAVGDPFAMTATEDLAQETMDALSASFAPGEILSDGTRSIGGMDASTYQFAGSTESADGEDSDVFIWAAFAYDANTHTHYEFIFTLPDSGTSASYDEVLQAVDGNAPADSLAAVFWDPFDKLLDSVKLNAES